MKSVSSRMVVRTSVAAAVIVIAVLAYTIMPPRAAGAYPALSFSVNSSADTHDLVPGDGSCKDGGGQCTLRAAIMKANHYPGGGVTIIIPAGTYTLTIASAGIDDETSGD